jgi:hypothetical protein
VADKGGTPSRGQVMKEDFPAIFDKLKRILADFEGDLIVKADGPENYYLDTPFVEKYKKELFFGAAQIKKNYVSYHLMPVYMFPDLLDDVSPGLKKRMQGKSCFNFTNTNEETLSELAGLTRKGFDRLKQENLI